MTEFSVEQKGSTQYLVYDLAGSGKVIDEISVMMVNSNQKNNIGIAKISFEELNGEKQRMLFDITGMMPLGENLQQMHTQKAFRDMMLAIIFSIEHLDEFMIDIHQIMFDINYVYINPVTKQVRFICLPFTEPEQNMPTTYEFIRNICAVSNVEAVTGETSYFNLVLNVLSNPSAFSVSNLREVLAPELSAAAHPAKPAQPAMQQPNGQPVPPAQAGQPQQNMQQPMNPMNPMNPKQPPVPPMPNGPVQEKGDVAFMPQNAIPMPPKPASAPNAGAADFTGTFQMPGPDEGKSENGLLGKLKKMFNKKEGDAAPNPAGMPNGAPVPNPVGMPMPDGMPQAAQRPSKSKKKGAAPAPMPMPNPAPMPNAMPMPNPAPMQNAMPMPNPAPMPNAMPMPNPAPMPKMNNAAESNHTIFVPPVNSQAAKVGGLAGINARMNQVEQDLFSDPAAGLPQNGNDIMGGGMAGNAAAQGFSQTPPQRPVKRQPEPEAAPVPAPAPLPAAAPMPAFSPMPGVSPAQPAPMPAQPAPAPMPAQPAPAPAGAPVQPPTQPYITNEGPKTVLLDPSQADDRTVRMAEFCLIRSKDQSRIRLEKPLIRVGRNRDDIDINLPENLHIGHMHATLLLVGGSYSVIDNDSANHTYVNHARLEPQKQYPLKDGDRISFADEEFEFRIGM